MKRYNIIPDMVAMEGQFFKAYIYTEVYPYLKRRPNERTTKNSFHASNSMNALAACTRSIYSDIQDDDTTDRSGRLVPLMGTNNVRVHSREMVVDVVLLLVGISLLVVSHDCHLSCLCSTHRSVHALPKLLLELCATLNTISR